MGSENKEHSVEINRNPDDYSYLQGVITKDVYNNIWLHSLILILTSALIITLINPSSV